MSKRKKLGVGIGRFQLDELHEGHVYLLDKIAASHDEMLILVGHNTIRFNTDDPFPFHIRKQMLESRYPRATVLPLMDSPVSNEAWSQTVDQKVRAVSHNGEAILYGGRDSFIPYYSGAYDTEEVSEMPDVSATAKRAEVGDFIDDPMFRKGWLAAINNQYAVTDPTVDMAIVSPDFTKVLMGLRGADAAHIRFFGGFVDSEDESYEAAAEREQFEEATGITVSQPTYIASARIKDSRYRKSKYGIMTTFFALTCLEDKGAAGADDMPAVEWCDLDASLYKRIAPEHEILVDKLLVYKERELAA